MPSLVPASEGAKGLLQAMADSASYEIHVGPSPDAPDSVIAIKDTLGEPPNPKWLLDFPSLQIEVRGPHGGYIAAWRIAKKVKDLLLGIDSVDINGDRWVSVTIFSDIVYIGLDGKNRPSFTINFNLIVEPLTSDETSREPL